MLYAAVWHAACVLDLTLESGVTLAGGVKALPRVKCPGKRGYVIHVFPINTAVFQKKI